jgi:hypothetical protein
MSVLFDFTKNFTILTTPYFESVPTDEELWRDIFNPGHDGASIYLFIDYTFTVAINGVATSSVSLQYMEVGADPATWVTIQTKTGAGTGTEDIEFDAKKYITTTLGCPVMFRIIGTCSTIYMKLDTVSGSISVRMVGTVD